MAAASAADALGTTLDALTEIVRAIVVGPFSQLNSVAAGVTASLSRVREATTSLVTGPLASMQTVVQTLAAVSMKGLSDAVGAATSAVGQAAVALTDAAAGPISSVQLSMSAALAPLAQLGTSIKDLITTPLAVAGDQIAAMTAPMASLVGVLSGFRDAVGAASQAMAPFVAALAPGLLNQFNYVIAGLSATIGSALAPAFQVLNNMIGNVAGVIAPVMHQLAPILGQFAQTIGAAIVPIVGVMAAALQACMPLFQFLADVLRGLVPIFQALSVVMEAVNRTMGAMLQVFFGGDKMKGFMENFRNAIEQVAKQLVLLSARIAMMFGDAIGKGGYMDQLTATLKGRIDQLNKPPQGDAPAPSGAGTSSLESIGQQISSLAFLAGGGAVPEPPDVKVLTEILDAVKGMSQDSLGSVILKAIEDAWDWIKKQAPPGLDPNPLNPGQHFTWGDWDWNWLNPGRHFKPGT